MNDATTTHTAEELAAYVGRSVMIQTAKRGLVRAKVLEVVPGHGTANPPFTLFVSFETGEEGSGYLPADFK